MVNNKKFIKNNKSKKITAYDIYLKKMKDTINRKLFYEKKFDTFLANNKTDASLIKFNYYVLIILAILFSIFIFCINYNIVTTSIFLILFMPLFILNIFLEAVNQNAYKKIIDTKEKYKDKLFITFEYDKKIKNNTKQIFNKIKDINIYNQNLKKYNFAFRTPKFLIIKQEVLSFYLNSYLIFLFDDFLIRYNYSNNKIEIYKYTNFKIKYFKSTKTNKELQSYKIHKTKAKIHHKYYLHECLDGTPDLRYKNNPLFIHYIFHGLTVQLNDSFNVTFISEDIETLNILVGLFKNQKLPN